MPDLSAKSRANFLDLASGVDSELAKLRPARELATQRSRQINYLMFCKLKLTGGEDPCGNGVTWQHMVVCYTRNLVYGSNIRNLDLRAETVELYLKAVSKLFTQRGFDSPVDFRNPVDKSIRIIENVRRWQKVPNRREALTPEMIELIISNGRRANPDSFEAAMADWVSVGIYNGQRLAEFGQKKQFEIDYHETPQGRRIMKASLQEIVFTSTSTISSYVTQKNCQAELHALHWTGRYKRTVGTGRNMTSRTMWLTQSYAQVFPWRGL